MPSFAVKISWEWRNKFSISISNLLFHPSFQSLWSMYISIFKILIYFLLQLPPTKLSDSDCASPCAGNLTQMCGGSFRNSVYKTWLFHKTHNKTKWRIDILFLSALITWHKNTFEIDFFCKSISRLTRMYYLGRLSELLINAYQFRCSEIVCL